MATADHAPRDVLRERLTRALVACGPQASYEQMADAVLLATAHVLHLDVAVSARALAAAIRDGANIIDTAVAAMTLDADLDALDEWEAQHGG